MARISKEEAGSTNMLAFLDMLAYSEGTSTSRYTKDDGYDIIVDGVDSPRTFSDYSQHPNVLVVVQPAKPGKDALKSTAAGRYQFLYGIWQGIVRAYNFRGRFTPEAQDLGAIKLIGERKAIADVHAGRFEEAVAKCCKTWASLPGSPYGQPTHKIEVLRKKYLDAGGKIAA